MTMTESVWRNILSCLKVTDDIAIIAMDDTPLVVMNFDKYRRLIDSKPSLNQLSQDEFLHKINNDIALWRNAQDKNVDTPVEYDSIPKNAEESADGESGVTVEPIATPEG